MKLTNQRNANQILGFEEREKPLGAEWRTNKLKPTCNVVYENRTRTIDFSLQLD